MKKYLTITILAIVLPILLISTGNNDLSGTLKKYLGIYNKRIPREKIYIQTDKTYYSPEEAIWYKGFIVNANSNKPSEISDVVYVELHDPWGNIVEKREHLADGGTYNGEFLLAENTSGGLYKLIAYTSWMKNWGEQEYFTKEITVQKVITPRLLLKIDFEKRAYGPSDEVVANLKVTDLNNVKTNNSDVKSTVRIGGVAVQTLNDKTRYGEVAVKFNLPKDLNTSDGILQIVVADKGLEESITRSIPIVLNKIAVSFYPEGGDLIENVHSKIAFEALNEFGKGADVSGNIVDEAGTTVCQFESFHLGMGAFEFTPLAGKKYYAQITRPVGINASIALPEIQKTGYVLNLKSKDENKLQWNIYSPNVKSVNFVGQTQGEIYYSQQLQLKKGYNTIEVPTNEFPIGIAVFTLFNENNSEACERLVFLNADKGLNINIITPEVHYPGTTNEIVIKTTDKKGKPVSANLGLAVVDEQLLTMADDKQDNMLSSILFSSELKGKIQEPYFYFDETEAKAKSAIDYLMLTHGWRRFGWSEVLNPSTEQLTELTEKLNRIYGYVLNAKSKPVQAEVYLVETEGLRRIACVKTTPEGHFAFHNVDVTGNVFITTKLPNQVYLFKGKPIMAIPEKTDVLTDSLNDENVIIAELPELEEAVVDMNTTNNKSVVAEAPPSPYANFGNAQLDEVVVIGYGVQKKASMTGSVQTVRATDILVTTSTIASALAGRIAGISVEAINANPAAEQKISIRGSSSVMSQGDPLVIINGVPVSGEDYSAAISFVNPSDIESITVLKNASASAVYGSRAANGVIIVNTKVNTRGLREVYNPGKGKFGGVMVQKRQFYTSTKVYQNNESSTVYWNGNVKTNDNGIASINFGNSLQSSAFRITVEGMAPGSGLIGSKTASIVTRKPLSIDAKIPLFAGVGDLVKVPVMVRNSTNDSLPVSVTIILSNNSILGFEISRGGPILDYNEDTAEVIVAPNESKTIYFPVKALKAGKSVIDFQVQSGNNKYFDSKKSSITVRQIDFPYTFSFSGLDMEKIEKLELPDHIPGSLQAEAVSYSSMLDELFDGVESIFREPYGCFEQASSSTFPNIFAMQLINATGQEMPEVRKKAMRYLENGYKKLISYEVPGGGFEWFGKDPAHTGLTAYGVIEFYEMNKIYDKVDKKMVERSRKFILNRKNGKGGFHNSTRGYDSFSGSPQTISDAYIVYAMTETEGTKDVEDEYKHVLAEALKSEDMYRMALVANSAFNMGDMESYKKLIGIFREFIMEKEFAGMKIETTIVRTMGTAKPVETTAFWLLALLKNNDNIDFELVNKCIQFLTSNRRYGSFGNTQATSVSLQALSKYAQLMQNAESGDGYFCVNINGKENCKKLLKAKIIIDLNKKLVKGDNTIQIKYTGIEKPVPYSINVSWQSKTPATSKLCPLKLSTHLASNTLKVNETVRLSVKLKNTQNNGQPMSIAVIGIPGGLSLQPWQLKELQEQEVYDFYEILNDNLVIYYRSLGADEEKTINLDLKAEIPGEYKGIASSTYLYYTNEYKHWIDGISIKITE